MCLYLGSQKLSKKYAKRKKEEKEHLLSRNNYIRLLQLQILTKTRLLRAEIFSLPSASPPFSLFFFIDLYVYYVYKDRSLCARVSLSRAKIYVRVSLFLSFFPFFFFLGALLEVSLAQIRRARNRSGESFEFQVLVRALVLLILFLIGTRASNLAFLSGGRRGRQRRLAFR